MHACGDGQSPGRQRRALRAAVGTRGRSPPYCLACLAGLMCHSLLSDHNRRCEALGNGHYSHTTRLRWRVRRPPRARRPCAGRWRPAAPRCPGPPGWPAVSTGQPRDGRGRRLVKAWRRQAPSRAAYSVGPSVTQAAAWERACVMAPHCVLAVLCPFAASSCGGRRQGRRGAWLLIRRDPALLLWAHAGQTDANGVPHRTTHRARRRTRPRRASYLKSTPPVLQSSRYLRTGPAGAQLDG